MSQILDPIPNEEGDSLLCSYINATSQIQVARITNVPNWYFERVVFPGQRLVFEAVSYGILEIHSGMMASSILSDRIPCKRLAIQDSVVDEEKTSRSSPPEISSPEISSPEISSPEISSPEISSPEISSPEISSKVSSELLTSTQANVSVVNV